MSLTTHGGAGRNQGRKRTDVRNLTAIPPSLRFDVPAVAFADVTLHWCTCGAAWWEPFIASYSTGEAQPEPDANGYDFHLLATAENPGQKEWHNKECPLRK